MNLTDRTQDFLECIQTCGDQSKIEKSYSQRFLGSNYQVHTTYLPQNQTQFLTLSSDLHKRLDLTESRLTKLKELNAQEGESLFNKNGQQISNLSNLISTDVQEFKLQLESLSQAKQQQLLTNEQNKQKEKCYQSMLEILRARVLNMSRDFKNILQNRTSCIKQAEEKRKLLGFSKSINANQNQSRPAFLNFSQNETAIQEEIYETSMIQSRAESIESIEKMLHQLAGLFEQLSLMVHQQQLMVDRIDQYTDEALLQLESGRREIGKYYESVTNWKALMAKVFLVIFVSFIVYITILSPFVGT